MRHPKAAEASQMAPHGYIQAVESHLKLLIPTWSCQTAGLPRTEQVFPQTREGPLLPSTWLLVYVRGEKVQYYQLITSSYFCHRLLNASLILQRRQISIISLNWNRPFHSLSIYLQAMSPATLSGISMPYLYHFQYKYNQAPLEVEVSNEKDSTESMSPTSITHTWHT